jgi:hypothetical protein
VFTVLMGCRVRCAQHHSKTEFRGEQEELHVLLRQSCMFVLSGMRARSAQQPVYTAGRCSLTPSRGEGRMLKSRGA